MTDLSKNQRPRFGSDWDLDLGWVLIWIIVGLTISSVVWSIAWASVRNNARNNAKDEVFYKTCRQVNVTYIASNNQKTYECK